MILVMHPERCMESRVHNVVSLRTTSSIALTQLRRSVTCAREWSRYPLGDESVPKQKRTRAVLDLNERIFRKCLRSHAFQEVALDYEAEPFEAVLLDDRLPAMFAHDGIRRWPRRFAASPNVVVEIGRGKLDAPPLVELADLGRFTAAP